MRAFMSRLDLPRRDVYIDTTRKLATCVSNMKARR